MEKSLRIRLWNKEREEFVDLNEAYKKVRFKQDPSSDVIEISWAEESYTLFLEES